MKSRVWVTGSGGLIGSYVVGEASVGLPIEVVPLNRQNLDLLDFHAVRERFAMARMGLFIALPLPTRRYVNVMRHWRSR